MRNGGALVVAAALAAAPGRSVADEGGPKQAEGFEAVARGAVRVERSDLAGLIWAVVAPCDQGDDLIRRQCRAVRTARARRLDGKTLIVPGDAAAFTVGAYDEKKQTAALTVSGCVACVEPIVVGDVPYYVTAGKDAPGFTGGVAAGATVHVTHKRFDDEAALSAWRAEVAPRLRAELVLSIDVGAAPWKSGGRRGLGVTVTGFRVYDPCDGKVVCSSPHAERGEVDRSVCGESVAEGAADAPRPRRARAPELPEELTAAMIKEAMRPARAAADACFATHGVAGDGKLHVTVNADGAVTALDVDGDFEGTPTGECIAAAVKAISFPRTKKSKQSFKYPIVLR